MKILFKLDILLFNKKGKKKQGQHTRFQDEAPAKPEYFPGHYDEKQILKTFVPISENQQTATLKESVEGKQEISQL